MPFIVCYISRFLLILDLEQEKLSPDQTCWDAVVFPLTAMQNVDCLLGLAGQISPNQPADIARAFKVTGNPIHHLFSGTQRCEKTKTQYPDNQTILVSLKSEDATQEMQENDLVNLCLFLICHVVF